MTTTTKFTTEQEAEITSYMKQGQDRATAERIVKASARNRKPSTSKGNLNGSREFSLLK